MTKRVFAPPFLKYPRDAAAIQSILLQYRKAHPAPLSAATGIRPELAVTAMDGSFAGGLLPTDPDKIAVATEKRPRRTSAAPKKAAAQTPAGGVASTSVELFLNQLGHLSIGAHCSATIEGVVHCINQQPVGWFDFEFAPSQTGLWQKAAFIGASGNADTMGNIPFSITIDADLYAGLYGAGNKWFRVVFNEMNVHWGNTIVTMPLWSDPVLLDFASKAACNIIHAVRFHIGGQDVGADCTLTGSQNGAEPTFVVTLAQPALADQTIRISTDNANLGWIVTNKSGNTIDLTIPAGQQTGALSWFLGTKKVITTGKQFHVVATLIQPDGTVGNYGLGKVSLTKT